MRQKRLFPMYQGEMAVTQADSSALTLNTRPFDPKTPKSYFPILYNVRNATTGLVQQTVQIVVRVAHTI